MVSCLAVWQSAASSTHRQDAAIVAGGSPGKRHRATPVRAHHRPRPAGACTAQQGTINQQVHDGDTVTSLLDGNLGIRFWAWMPRRSASPCPATRDSFPSPTRPGSRSWPTRSPPACRRFPRRCRPSCTPSSPVGSALARQPTMPGLGTVASGALRELVRADVAALGQTEATFRLFCAFAHEVMDGFGRLLCFLNRQQPSAPDPGPRPRSYNERMLQAGWVVPYFIWPNIDPFRRHGSLIDAVPKPGTANTLAEQQGGALQVARQFVRDARAQHLGLFEQADPLRLLPFELRFLARRAAPERWVIDLGRNDDTLIAPQAYFQVRAPEDRLFVPAEYVPLFVEKGWHRLQ